MNLPLIVFFVSFAAVFLLRVPIAPGMMMSSAFYFLLSENPAASLDMVAMQFLTNMNASFILIAVPLFVFMAEIMNSGKVTNMIFSFSNALVGKRKGALGHVNVIASIIFSGMTGSALADASGLGSMEIKAMRERGYDGGYTCAITAASATIGPIIPPSIPMVVYAMLSSTSIGYLFLGGIIPGLLIGIGLMVYNAIISRARNYPEGEKLSPRQFWKLTLQAVPALFSVVILLGGIYTGVVTPTEAGALAAFYAMIVSIFFYRALGWKEFKQCLINAVRTTGTLSLLVGSAFAFSYIITIEQIPNTIATFLLTLTQNKYLMLLILNISFLLLGCFLDTTPIQLIFTPIVIPILNQLGIDLVHFGVVMVLNLMIGLSTPPYGMLLFTVSGISGTPLRAVIKEIIPMIIVIIAVLFLITYIPDLVLFIPRLSGYK
ncbi:MAG TPA: TRAP transporter large permease [Spirochaetales bacterium]|nr:TRAP transporter large permease [Spirochaetales bacterium]HOV38500.1 TRAP transporter large permease [Spirochaetales bacterium]